VACALCTAEQTQHSQPPLQTFHGSELTEYERVWLASTVVLVLYDNYTAATAETTKEAEEQLILDGREDLTLQVSGWVIHSHTFLLLYYLGFIVKYKIYTHMVSLSQLWASRL
jgi:hypothetical protein